MRSEQGTEVWLDEIRPGIHVNTCDVHVMFGMQVHMCWDFCPNW